MYIYMYVYAYIYIPAVCILELSPNILAEMMTSICSPPRDTSQLDLFVHFNAYVNDSIIIELLLPL